MLRKNFCLVLFLLNSALLACAYDWVPGDASTVKMEPYPVPPDIAMSTTVAATEADDADALRSADPPKTAATETPPVTLDTVTDDIHAPDDSSNKIISQKPKDARDSALPSWIDFYYKLMQLVESKKNRRSPNELSIGIETESPETNVPDPRRTPRTPELIPAAPGSTESPDTRNRSEIATTSTSGVPKSASSTEALTSPLPVIPAPAAPKKPRRKWKKPKKKPVKKLPPITTTTATSPRTTMATTMTPATTTLEAANTATEIATWSTETVNAKSVITTSEAASTSTQEAVIPASPIYAILATIFFVTGTMVILPLVSIWTRVRRLRHRNEEGDPRSIKGVIDQRALLSVLGLVLAALLLETQNGPDYESLVSKTMESGFGVIWILTVGFSLVFENLSTRRSNFEDILLFAHKFLADVAFGFACLIEFKYGVSRGVNPEGHSLSAIEFSPTWVAAMFGVYACLKEVLDYVYVIRRRAMIIPICTRDPEYGQSRRPLSTFDRYRSRMPGIFKFKPTTSPSPACDMDEVVVIGTAPTPLTSDLATNGTTKATGDV